MREKFLFKASPPMFKPPPRGCDCHLHLFGPVSQYPYAESRTYTPMEALPEEGIRMLETLGMERAVLVQPSSYGTDNTLLLDALNLFGNKARAVAVVPDDISPVELGKLDTAGVRGIRLNIGNTEQGQIKEIALWMQRLARRINDFKWHLEVFINAHRLDKIVGEIERLPVDLVFDHMGNIRVSGEKKYSGMEILTHLLKKEKCWVKLSAPYRLDDKLTRPKEIKILARTLIKANPDRVVWGSDWPHTAPHGYAPDSAGKSEPFRKIDTGRMLDYLFDWVPEKSLREKILVDNPTQLYRFN